MSSRTLEDALADRQGRAASPNPPLGPGTYRDLRRVAEADGQHFPGIVASDPLTALGAGLCASHCISSPPETRDLDLRSKPWPERDPIDTLVTCRVQPRLNPIETLPDPPQQAADPF
jgi:hypothetical protein